MTAATTALSVIPQPPTRPLLGNAPQIGGDTPVQSLMRLAREYGELFRLTLPGRRIVVATSHRLVDELCDETRFDKYLHGPLQNVRDFAGDGLFTANTTEANWGKAHRLLTPAFGPHAMKAYFTPMLDVAQTLLDKWARLGPDAELDVADNMTRLTLDTIALCGFDYRFNSFYQREMHPFVDAMVRSLAEAGARTKRLKLQNALMLRANAQYARDVAFMNGVVDEVIRERKAGPRATEQNDLLGRMLNAVDPVTGERLDDLNIRHQIVTFLIAGHETTSGLLSFTLYQLLRHPEVLARATDEATRVLGDGVPTFEQLRQLTYLDQVLRESLRVWPTAPAFALAPKEDTVLGGRYALRAGQPVLVLVPQLHRDPTVWPEPERFDPDRFAPERRDAIPANAWKPFGNGQRACIGNLFAMQEALLVLAMMLRRFELSDPHRYQLKVKETLTLKPDGFVLRARERPQQHAPTARPSAPAKTEVPRAAKHGTKLLVLFGSNSGSSEAFARRLGSDGEAAGYAVTVDPLDAWAGKLPTDGAVAIVTASYNGQPPDNAKRFCAWVQTVQPAALAGVRYTVFGCGNRDWAATYQAVPTLIDEALEKAGATRLAPRGASDARADFFGPFEAWNASLWPTLAAAFSLQATAAGPRYRIERSDATHDPLHETHGARDVEVVGNRELVDLSSPFGRSKRELQLRLPEGMTYRPGDHLQVLAENQPEVVARAAKRFGLSLDEPMVLHSDRRSPLPLERPVTARLLLSRYVELSQPATRLDVQALADATRCPPEKRALLQLVQAHQVEVLDRRVSLLDLLERFAACELDFASFLERLPAMQPRRYSISSAPLDDPRRCTLTVAVAPHGVASNHLARCQPGDRLLACVRAPHAPFALPDDATTPVVMIAAGTGLAPFRGFIEARAAQPNAGPMHLFFGCDHPDVDLLYRDELERWAAQGVVTLHFAYFRKPEHDITFVQHRLWADRAQLPAGAQFYVCGDGRRMAPAVRETLERIVGVEALEGHYRADVFGS